MLGRFELDLRGLAGAGGVDGRATRDARHGEAMDPEDETFAQWVGLRELRDGGERRARRRVADRLVPGFAGRAFGVVAQDASPMSFGPRGARDVPIELQRVELVHQPWIAG